MKAVWFLVFTLFTHSLCAQQVTIALEPMPPFVTHETTGEIIDLLQEIDSDSPLNFQILIMPYNRAIRELKQGRVDMIGLTPIGLETPDFYQFAQDIDWGFDTALGVYALSPTTLKKELHQLTRIGIPRGNEHFHAKTLNIPITHFIPGEITNLVEMLLVGRLDLVIFEHNAISRAIYATQQQDLVYFKLLSTIKTGFSVQKNQAGNQLKEQIEERLKKIATDRYLLSVPDNQQLNHIQPLNPKQTN